MTVTARTAPKAPPQAGTGERAARAEPTTAPAPDPATDPAPARDAATAAPPAADPPASATTPATPPHPDAPASAPAPAPASEPPADQGRPERATAPGPAPSGGPSADAADAGAARAGKADTATRAGADTAARTGTGAGADRRRPGGTATRGGETIRPTGGPGAPRRAPDASGPAATAPDPPPARPPATPPATAPPGTDPSASTGTGPSTDAGTSAGTSTGTGTSAGTGTATGAAGAAAAPGVETASDVETEGGATPRERRSADARALTQVLFAELSGLEPGTPEHARVRTALIEANLPLVRYAAARFRSRNEPIEDVIQVGTIGLINAIDRFDPHRGVQFPTFAMPTVVGEIKRYFRDNVRTVHVPRRLHELWVQVSGATEDLTVLHGRSPTTAEIAARLGIGEDEVLACIEAGRSYHATSLEAAQEGDGLPGLLDRLGYEDPALAGVEHRDLVRHLLVQLPEREQRILLLRYYSNLTQSQISAELGVSQMHVSRLLSRSFARLRSANRIEP